MLTELKGWFSILTIGFFSVVFAQDFRPLPNVQNSVEQTVHGSAFVAGNAAQFLIDTGIVYSGSPPNEETPTVAFDGVNFLAVWRDNRNKSGIYAARISQTGAVLDSAGIVVSSTVPCPGWPYRPVVSFNGTHYLIVWADLRNNAQGDIYGARVTPDGVVLDTAGIVITAASGSQSSPYVAFDGTSFWVVWSDLRSGSSDIYGARVTFGGLVLDPNGVVISATPQNQWWPRVTASDSNCLVIWADGRIHPGGDIYGARVSAQGAVLDPAGFRISATSGNAETSSADFDGTDYFVVWAAAGQDVYGTRVSRSGVVLEPSHLLSLNNTSAYRPFVVFDDTNHLVSWEDRIVTNCAVVGARVNRACIPLDSTGIVIARSAGSVSYPSAAFGRADYLVVWGNYDVLGARVSTDGVVLDTTGLVVSTAANAQQGPSVAFDGSSYLVVWEDGRDWRNGQFDIYGMRVSEAGALLDPRSIPISQGTFYQSHPSIACDGSEYLVVWQDARNGGQYDIYGARVLRDGTVLDPNGIQISAGSFSEYWPAVVFDGSNYLVTWMRYIGLDGDIYGARVSPAGVVVDPMGIPICTAAQDQEHAALASDGTNCLVVWCDYRDTSGYAQIFGARVTKTGVILDPGGILVCDSASQSGHMSPSVAFDEVNYFVVCAEWPDVIIGSRVSTAGTVLDTAGLIISASSVGQYNPVLTFDGTDYLCAWERSRDLRGARIHPTGVVVDSFSIVARPFSQVSPAAAHGTGDRVFVTYSGWTDSINYRPANTLRVWGMLMPPVKIDEMQSADCRPRLAELSIEPNPFRQRVVMKFHIPNAESRASLKVFDVSGRCVRTFRPPASRVAGSPLAVNWDGDDDAGRVLPAGVYFCRVASDDRVMTRKLVKVE